MILQPRKKSDITGYAEQTISGWLVKTFSNGEKEATVGIDYLENTDFTWTAITTTLIQELLPSGVFTQVNECVADVIDITPNATYKNSIIVATNELPSTTATSKICLVPAEYVFGDSNYAVPTKLHIVWTVRGI